MFRAENLQNSNTIYGSKCFLFFSYEAISSCCTLESKKIRVKAQKSNFSKIRRISVPDSQSNFVLLLKAGKRNFSKYSKEAQAIESLPQIVWRLMGASANVKVLRRKKEAKESVISNWSEWDFFHNWKLKKAIKHHERLKLQNMSVKDTFCFLSVTAKTSAFRSLRSQVKNEVWTG